jgi:hypothetical protein
MDRTIVQLRFANAVFTFVNAMVLQYFDVRLQDQDT